MHRRVLKFLQAGFAAAALAFASRAYGQAPPNANAASTPANLPSSSAPIGDTVRLIAVRNDGTPVTDLRAEDLRVRLRGQYRKILALSSTTSSPKRIGIFLDATYYREFDLLASAEIDTLDQLLQTLWQEQDQGFLVSFSDRIYDDVVLTGDLAQLRAGLRKVLSRDLRHVPKLTRHSPDSYLTWYDALDSVASSESKSGQKEILYFVLSDFLGPKTRAPGQKVMLDSTARVFAFLVSPNSEAVPPPFYESCDCFDRHGPEHDSQQAAKTVALRSGGDVFYTASRKDLARGRQRMQNELQSTYLVTYDPLSGGASKEKPQVESSVPGVRLIYPKD